MKSSKKGGKLGEFDFTPGEFDTSSGKNFGEFRGVNYPADFPPTDPFDNVEYTGNPEIDARAELNEYQKEVKNHLRDYSATIDGVFSSNFWFAVTFKDEPTKDAFLEEFGLGGKKIQYLDGNKVARQLRSLIAKAASKKK